MALVEISAGVGMFTVVVLALVAIILGARSRLVVSGDVSITINDDPDHSVITTAGGKLLNVLADNKIFVSSACGGGGTCAQCKVHVFEGGGDILATELSHISRGQAREGMRLSCQVNVKQDMKIEVPAEVFSVRKWECEVVSNDNVATFIKELVLKLPEGEVLDFESGGFIQIDVPPFEADFSNFDIDESFHDDWNRFNVWDLKTVNTETVFRAYSMANHPAEGNIVMLNIRIATPPPDRERGGWMNVTPGLASSYAFNLKQGDKATISGPFGEFFIQDTKREMKRTDRLSRLVSECVCNCVRSLDLFVFCGRVGGGVEEREREVGCGQASCIGETKHPHPPTYYCCELRPANSCGSRAFVLYSPRRRIAPWISH